MHSSTSSSDFDVLIRDLPAARLGAAGVLALGLCALGVLAWENHWRHFGAEPGYFLNSDGLWAKERRRIDHGEGNKIVAVGSSRMLFDLNLDAWEAASGERPIQLALEGNSPVGIMENLAEDPDFTGTLLVGLTPGLFFSGFEYRKGALQRYLQESPSQWLGQQISMLIEPYFAFLHGDFALFAVLERQQHEPWFPDRAQVEWRRDVRKLSNMQRDRFTQLWHKVEDDPEYQQLVRSIWEQGFVPIDELPEEEVKAMLENRAVQLDRAVAAVQKLHARGVEVIFVRMPSAGYYAERSEPQYNPRAETWDVLLERTGALGIHWADHVELQGFTLPEWSHIAADETYEFTLDLYEVIQRERARREQGQTP